MDMLLDTHVFLWWNEGHGRLGEEYCRKIIAADNVFVSVISGWEISEKIRKNKIGFMQPFDRVASDNNFFVLPVESRHVAFYANLMAHHKDPFDRMLIAQAMCESLTLVTADCAMRRYPVDMLFVD